MNDEYKTRFHSYESYEIFIYIQVSLIKNGVLDWLLNSYFVADRSRRPPRNLGTAWSGDHS